MSELSLEKLRIEKTRQKMLAQEYQLRAGELVDAEKVDREMFRIDRWVRERWLAFFRRLWRRSWRHGSAATSARRSRFWTGLSVSRSTSYRGGVVVWSRSASMLASAGR